MNIEKKLETMERINAANERHIAEWKAKRQITGVLVDVNAAIAKRCTIENTPESFRLLLNCNKIDNDLMFVGDERFLVIFDREAIFKPHPRTSMVNKYGSTMMYGNVFIVNFNATKGAFDLSDDDIDHILKRVVLYRCRVHRYESIAVSDSEYR